MEMHVVLQALTAMAWANGRPDDTQRGILQELFGLEGLNDETHRRWLSEPVDFPSREQLEGFLVEPSDRMDFVTQLLHMALTDHELQAAESRLLLKLGESFGVDESVLADLGGG